MIPREITCNTLRVPREITERFRERFRVRFRMRLRGRFHMIFGERFFVTLCQISAGIP